jgi:hypothetical protein
MAAAGAGWRGSRIAAVAATGALANWISLH